MINDHSNGDGGNLLLALYVLCFLISSKVGFFNALFHRQNDAFHNLCYISRGALTGTRNSLMGPQ